MCPANDASVPDGISRRPTTAALIIRHCSWIQSPLRRSASEIRTTPTPTSLLPSPTAIKKTRQWSDDDDDDDDDDVAAAAQDDDDNHDNRYFLLMIQLRGVYICTKRERGQAVSFLRQ